MKVPAQSEASEDQKLLSLLSSLLLFSFTYGEIFGGSGNKFLHVGLHPQTIDPDNVCEASQVAQW